jgi:hypothetical protein
MRPLSWIAPGLFIVAIDFRLNAIDVLLDPVGWLMIAMGAWQLARPATVTAVGVATLASLAEVTLPYRWAQISPETGKIIDEVTTTRYAYPEVLVYDRVSGARLVLLALSYLAAGVALWMLLRDLAARARSMGRSSTAKQLGLLRGLVPGLWIAPYLIGMVTALIAGRSFDPVWNGGLEYLALAGLIPMLWLALLLGLERDRAWALPTESPSPPPWIRRTARLRWREAPAPPSR